MNCAPSDPLIEHLALVVLAEVELVRLVDDAHDLQVGGLAVDLGRDGQQDDGQDAGALLARGLGDELLDPVGQAHDVGAVGDEAELVAARLAAGDRRGEHERGVVGAVDRDLEERRIRLVEELGDVDAGEPRGHEPERGERRVAPADGRVGVEDGVAVGARRHVERRTGVGDDDDALERVDAEVAEGRLERALGRVGLDRRAGLGRHDEDGLRQAAPLGVAVERGEHLAGRGRVEDHQRHAGRLGDDLGRERRAAHAGEHDARDALARRAAARSAAISATSGRETLTASTQPSRWDASSSAAGPHSDASPAVMPDATRLGDEAGKRLVDDRLDVSAQVDLESSSSDLRRVPQRGLDGVLQLVPGGDELLDALVLEHLGDVGEVDADGGELVEHAVRVGVGAGDGVAGDVAVVERRLERLLGHRVHGAGGDELGDVQGVGQRRVLDAGRGPQRTLHVGAGIRQRLRPVGGELLLEQLVRETRVRDAGLAT